MNKKRWWQHFLLPILNMPLVRYVDGDDGGGNDGGGNDGGDPPAISLDSFSGDAWATLIKEKYSDNASIQNTKSIEDALTQLTNAQKLTGVNTMAKPSDDWTDEQWNEFHNTLGRPDSAEAYEFKEVEGVEYPDSLKALLSEKAHAAGFNQKQYQALMDMYSEYITVEGGTQKEALATREAESRTALEKEYGDKFEGVIAQGKAIVNEFGSPEFIEFLDESGLGDNPAMVKFLAKIAEQAGDDSAIGNALNSNLSPTNGAVREIANLKEDENFQKKLHNESAPGHKDAVNHWMELHKKAYPGTDSR